MHKHFHSQDIQDLNNPPIIALHGFLGLPTDWLNLNLKSKVIPWNLNQLDPQMGLWDWAKELNSNVSNKASKPILMGYSFGGRLALHALINQPDRWSAAIIISSHPGLESQEEKSIRLIDDSAWALRILNDPWDLLMSDWNGRSVFSQGGFQFHRKETDFDRTHLSQLLISGSLGYQDHLLPLIAQLPMPILWMVGSQDTKYRNITSNLKFSHPQSQVWEVSGAGHRLPWEQPELVSDKINQFTSTCLSTNKRPSAN